MHYLICGLGNIGEAYDLTRHNVGFMVLDALAQQYGTSWQSGRLAMVSSFRCRNKLLQLIKPTTYMNRSGRAITYWLQQRKLSCANLLVVTDDVHLPFGKLRLRGQGSAAGHNGLGDITDSLHTQAFPRLRVGIGHDFPKGQQAQYVLAPFSAEEQQGLPLVIQQACKVVTSFCLEGVATAMNQYN